MWGIAHNNIVAPIQITEIQGNNITKYLKVINKESYVLHEHYRSIFPIEYHSDFVKLFI